MWIKLCFVAFLSAFLLPNTTVAQLEVFNMLNVSLTQTDSNIDYTNPATMSSNLATLATLMDNVTKSYFSGLRLTTYSWGYFEFSILTMPLDYVNDVSASFKIGLIVWLSMLSPMAEQIVTITNNTRYGVTTPAPAVSILDGLPIAFGIPNPGNVTLNIQSFSQDSAISPEIFSGQLAFFANQSKEIIARDRDLALAYKRTNNNNIITLGILAAKWTFGPLDNALNQILNITLKKMDPTYIDPSKILYTLGSLSSELKLIESYIPGNTSLALPDPSQTYTCGAIFTENLDSFFKLLNKTAIAASSLINSNSTAVTISSNVTQAVGEFNSVLPYLTNLTEQVTGMLPNETIMMSGLSRRRVYPQQVRTNLDRADCHKLYLKRYNERRFG
ncbi:uncharacterized protein LOC120423332 [Culex pipiens pallens]|uniref:uncharacterized protein LOC120423332 n=1 Tax=Culex pipiens pallens TaxID=42434 RepID=UPI0022AA995B|nr:uncharacterized protein LOC120423332 [Culex pipiens pallens]